MNAQAIMERLESNILSELAYHLAVPTGRLRVYHFAVAVADHDRVQQPHIWPDVVTEIYNSILRTAPFCMRAPSEMMQLDGSDTAQGDLLRVVRTYNIISQCTHVTVNFYGRVFNEPH